MILCDAVLNSGSCWSASAERLGENAPMKEEVCSSIFADLNTAGDKFGDTERSLFNAISCVTTLNASKLKLTVEWWLGEKVKRRQVEARWDRFATSEGK
jgi:hypothetical protein